MLQRSRSNETVSHSKRPAPASGAFR
jgi:hypothetical protein